MKKLIKSIAVVFIIAFIGSCEVKNTATAGQIIAFSLSAVFFIIACMIFLSKIGSNADKTFEEIVNDHYRDTEI